MVEKQKTKNKKLPYSNPLIIKMGALKTETLGAMNAGDLDSMGPNAGTGRHGMVS